MRSTDWLCERAFLTPKTDNATAINVFLMKSFQGVEVQYYAFVQTDYAVNYHAECLNTLNTGDFLHTSSFSKLGTSYIIKKSDICVVMQQYETIDKSSS